MIDGIIPNDNSGGNILESYGKGRFTISGDIVNSSIIIWPEDFKKWQVKDFSQLAINSFNDFLSLDLGIEILLLGCGIQTKFVAGDIRSHIKQAGMNFEFMTTAAAARSYNVMITDGRRVAAALIAL